MPKAFVVVCAMQICEKALKTAQTKVLSPVTQTRKSRTDFSLFCFFLSVRLTPGFANAQGICCGLRDANMRKSPKNGANQSSKSSHSDQKRESYDSRFSFPVKAHEISHFHDKHSGLILPCFEG